MVLGTKGVTLNLIPPFGTTLSGTHDISQDVDIATARLNYRFGDPAARYRSTERHFMSNGQASFEGLVQTLSRISLALGDLPKPTLENLEEWEAKALPIIQTSQSVAMAIRTREPAAAHILDRVARECEDMLTAVERDRHDPPQGDRVAIREKRISELQASVVGATQDIR